MNDATMQEYIVHGAEVAGWLLAGGLLGLLHFLSLRWSVRRLLGGRPLLSLGLQLLRFALTGGALTLVTAFFGAIPLLVGTLGLLAARTGVLKLEAL